MNSFKELCIRLRKKDYSLAEIAKRTKRSKTSVYFHIRGIPLSKTKIGLIRKAYGARFAALAYARKGKSKRGFKKIKHWDDSAVVLVSHLIFDGEIKGSGCVYTNRSSVLLKKIESAMKEIYIHEPKRYFDKKTGVSKIAYFNVALSAHLRPKAKELLAGVFDLSVEQKRLFLQAFFDDEGCIDFKPIRNVRRVRGYQKDVHILAVIHSLLKEFKITSKVQLPNEVVVTGKENLENFQKEINFSSGIYMNGKRANSVWKVDTEKRELLQRAIYSFK